MNLFEQLAKLSHEQWSKWMKYLFEKSVLNLDGTITIPEWAVERWKRQINTTYLELSEEEKQSDREEATKVMALIRTRKIKELE